MKTANSVNCSREFFERLVQQLLDKHREERNAKYWKGRRAQVELMQARGDIDLVTASHWLEIIELEKDICFE